MPAGVWSDFKELVRSRTDIVQLVGERVALQTRRGGREFVGLCPFHDDHDPSLRVDPDRQSYKCWACGEGGDCFAFIQKIENVAFRDALEMLATRANLELPRLSSHQQDGDGKRPDGKPTRKELLDVLQWAEGEFHTFLRTSSEGAVARDYLQSRGFTPASIERFRLGFAPVDWQFLQTRARGRFAPAQLIAARLINERVGGTGYYDSFVGRVMFPIRDASARTVAFGGRVVPGVGQESPAKYLNSSDSPLFAKNRLVYALDVARNAIVERGSAVVMEGYADCIMAHQFGVANAVATLGTALTDNHVAALKRFTRKVVLVFDGDVAGQAAAEKSLPRFITQDVDLRILTLSDAKDPADFLLAHGADAFQKLIETAPETWEYKLRLLIERIGLKSIDARNQIVTEMLDLLRQAQRFSGSAKENIVLNRLANRVGLSESQIREMLVGSRRKQSAGAASVSAGKARVAGDGVARDEVADAGKSSDSRGVGLLESELLEIILSDPSTVAAIRAEVAAEDFQHAQHRRLLELCYRLAEEGVAPSYDKLMAASEDAELKRLVVTLDGSAREKNVACKLRIDTPAAGQEPGRPALLSDAVGVWKQRRRVVAHEVSKGQWARQSEPTGTLDPADRELLRRATEIHRERSKAKSTT